jgi:hypothetical protein
MDGASSRYVDAFDGRGHIKCTAPRLLVVLTHGRCLAKARSRWSVGRSLRGCPRRFRETQLWHVIPPAAAGVERLKRGLPSSK